MVFGPDGPIDNTLRFPDECVRHKLLDMVGDLALAGCDLVGAFTASRSGHQLNAETGPDARWPKGQSIGDGTGAAPDDSAWTDGPRRSRNNGHSDQPTGASSTPGPKSTTTSRSARSRVVGPHVRIGRGTRLENNVTLMGRVTLGEDNHLYPGVVIGGEPQDVSYAGTDTQVIIGDHNIIRECVTINRGSEKEDGITSIGDHNFLMACCHVAHDCQLGNHIIITNARCWAGTSTSTTTPRSAARWPCTTSPRSAATPSWPA